MVDFIAENFFIVVIIIGAILSLLKNKSSTSDNENESTENPYSAGSTRNTYQSRSQGVNDDLTPSSASNSAATPGIGSVEEQQEQQMKQLEKRMGTRSMISDDEGYKSRDVGIGSSESKSESNKPYQQQQFKKELKGRLNQKGLIDSIVMAEVLGPPRAKKPYSSILTEKNR